VGLATVLATGLVAGVEPAQAADPLPMLKLERAQATVIAPRYEETVYLDVGVWAIAGAQPFEIRSYRTSYAHKLKAFLVRSGADQKLPSGSVTEDFQGLKKFFVVTLTDKKGKVVHRSKENFCPNNGDGQVRRRPDAPASSPYPYGCGGNPYTLGSVWGLQAGYATPAISYTEAKLKLGSYTAKVEIAPAFRTALKISAADGVTTVQVKVVKGEDDEHEDAKQSTRRARATKPLAPAAARPTGRASTPSGPLPDLRSLPAWGIAVERGRYLNFAATVWNAGPSPLVVDGFRQADKQDLMDAYQYFFDGSGNQVGYAPVGTMEWDQRDGHEHWHFTDFATYRLMDKHQKLVVRSQKEAFCLANTDAIDYTVPNANWNPENTELHSACGERRSIAVREVLEAGSGDTYEQSLPGQSFDLKGLKNGTYYIEVRANPEKKLSEASTSNNVSYRKVKVSGRAGHRKVKVAKIGIIKEPKYSDETH
jgi:hypothetical protein